MALGDLKSTTQTITIANGQTDSSAIDTGRGVEFGVMLPAAFTGTSISFKVSQDGTNYSALYNSSNTLISLTVTQGRAYALPADIKSFRWVKIVSGSAEGAARSLTVSAK